MNISHIALRTDNIELLKDFYCRWFNAVAGERYHNPGKNFTSYFLKFPDGDASLEIMNMPGIISRDAGGKFKGLCHLAISLGSKKSVDEMTEKLKNAGVPVLGEPRATGDGFYESVIADPDGNLLELTV
jgi:Lactoylglutathione lyase and related lyases